LRSTFICLSHINFSLACVWLLLLSSFFFPLNGPRVLSCEASTASRTFPSTNIFFSTVIKSTHIPTKTLTKIMLRQPRPFQHKCSKEQENTLIIQLVASAISLVVISLVIIFFQKNLFSAKKGCDVQWWGFGLFLYILSILYLLATIASLTWSSIDMSNYNKACEHK